MTTTASRSLRFLQALPAYNGGKRWELGHIARALPPPSVAPVFIDTFMGGGSVALFAKARGYRVIANDIARRSIIVGRGLIENDRVKLSREDVARLFLGEEQRGPGFVERVYGGEVLPKRHARFLDGSLEVARSIGGASGWLLQLLCLRYVLALRPMGNFGAKTIVQQIDAGQWESVNPTFLRDRLARKMESHPQAICEELCGKINAGVFSNGHRNEVFQGDAIEFLRETKGSVVYLDPPYGGTSAYESALKPLDSILAGKVVDHPPSEFSGRKAIESLERLLEACAHIPHLVLSYGNAVVSPVELSQLVSRHRYDVEMSVIAMPHLAGLASEESKARNREILIRAGRPR